MFLKKWKVLTLFKVGKSAWVNFSGFSWILSRDRFGIWRYWNRDRVWYSEISWKGESRRSYEFRIVKQRVRAVYRFLRNQKGVFICFGIAVWTRVTGLGRWRHGCKSRKLKCISAEVLRFETDLIRQRWRFVRCCRFKVWALSWAYGVIITRW